ncbi:MAG: MarR family transcriptional regulator [Erysipelotrichaceae bacterium]
MNETRQTLNELLVDLFNHILLIEENNLRKRNVTLSMNEVHILEAISKSGSKMMSAIAKALMVTQGTLSVSTNRLVKKGYVSRVRDEKDRRIIRLVLSDSAQNVLEIHDSFHEEMIDKLINVLKVDQDKELLNSLRGVMQFFQDQYQI